MKNPFIKDPPPKREGKIIDYISEMRKKRMDIEAKGESKTPNPATGGS